MYHRNIREIQPKFDLLRHLAALQQAVKLLVTFEIDIQHVMIKEQT